MNVSPGSRGFEASAGGVGIRVADEEDGLTFVADHAGERGRARRCFSLIMPAVITEMRERPLSFIFFRLAMFEDDE